jgi:peptidoglycan/LPS O-acetylase OafA/YrhL
VAGTTEGEVSGTRGFLPAVEGMRACAAIGVVITHVAFQTGHTTWSTGRLLGRFDLAVAVFFALSGFLLRGGCGASRPPGTTCGRGWSASCPVTWWPWC